MISARIKISPAERLVSTRNNTDIFLYFVYRLSADDT